MSGAVTAAAAGGPGGIVALFVIIVALAGCCDRCVAAVGSSSGQFTIPEAVGGAGPLAPLYRFSHNTTLLTCAEDGVVTAWPIGARGVAGSSLVAEDQAQQREPRAPAASALWRFSTGGPLVAVEYEKLPNSEIARTDPLARPFELREGVAYLAQPLTDVVDTTTAAAPVAFAELSTLLSLAHVTVNATDIATWTSLDSYYLDGRTGTPIAHEALLVPALHVLRHNTHIAARSLGRYEWNITISSLSVTPHLATVQGKRNADEAAPQNKAAAASAHSHHRQHHSHHRYSSSSSGSGVGGGGDGVRKRDRRAVLVYEASRGSILIGGFERESIQFVVQRGAPQPVVAFIWHADQVLNPEILITAPPHTSQETPSGDAVSHQQQQHQHRRPHLGLGTREVWAVSQPLFVPGGLGDIEAPWPVTTSRRRVWGEEEGNGRWCSAAAAAASAVADGPRSAKCEHGVFVPIADLLRQQRQRHARPVPSLVGDARAVADSNETPRAAGGGGGAQPAVMPAGDVSGHARTGELQTSWRIGFMWFQLIVLSLSTVSVFIGVAQRRKLRHAWEQVDELHDELRRQQQQQQQHGRGTTTGSGVPSAMSSTRLGPLPATGAPSPLILATLVAPERYDSSSSSFPPPPPPPPTSLPVAIGTTGSILRSHGAEPHQVHVDEVNECGNESFTRSPMKTQSMLVDEPLMARPAPRRVHSDTSLGSPLGHSPPRALAASALDPIRAVSDAPSPSVAMVDEGTQKDMRSGGVSSAESSGPASPKCPGLDAHVAGEWGRTEERVQKNGACLTRPDEPPHSSSRLLSKKPPGKKLSAALCALSYPHEFEESDADSSIATSSSSPRLGEVHQQSFSHPQHHQQQQQQHGGSALASHTTSFGEDAEGEGSLSAALTTNTPPLEARTPVNTDSPAPRGGPTRTLSLFQMHYEVLSRLGSGGGGVVFMVRHHITGIKYAIKLVLLSGEDDEKAVREAVVHSNLEHKNVVRFFHCWCEDIACDELRELGLIGRRYGVSGSLESLATSCSSINESMESDASAPSSSDIAASAASFGRVMKVLFLQMEYFKEGTLSDYLRDRICVDREENLTIFQQIARGLDYMHTKGLIHRDVKPSNCFCAENYSVIKLGDFGVSARARGQQQQLFGADSLQYAYAGEDVETLCVGSPMYSSIEQLSGKKASTASDVYSLGMLGFELLHTFSTQHERNDVMRLFREGNVPPATAAAFPEEVELLLAMTNPNPTRRPRMQELLDRIKRIQKQLKSPKATPAIVATASPGKVVEATVRHEEIFNEFGERNDDAGFVAGDRHVDADQPDAVLPSAVQDMVLTPTAVHPGCFPK